MTATRIKRIIHLSANFFYGASIGFSAHAITIGHSSAIAPALLCLAIALWLSHISQGIED